MLTSVPNAPKVVDTSFALSVNDPESELRRFPRNKVNERFVQSAEHYHPTKVATPVDQSVLEEGRANIPRKTFGQVAASFANKHA